MTSETGWVEPVDASELNPQHDDLEHWLRGIRTDLTDDPPEWLDAATTDNPPDWLGTATTDDGAEELPAVDDAEPVVERLAEPRPAQVIGRHRAED